MLALTTVPSGSVLFSSPATSISSPISLRVFSASSCFSPIILGILRSSVFLLFVVRKYVVIAAPAKISTATRANIIPNLVLFFFFLESSSSSSQSSSSSSQSSLLLEVEFFTAATFAGLTDGMTLVKSSSVTGTVPIIALGSFFILSKSTIISFADWYLFICSFSIAFNISLFKDSGTAEFIFLGGTTSSCICFKATETGESASNGTLPVTISYITTPKEYKSVLLSI
ncbi:hypothetical protein D3C81_1460390 [compost metagenome]